MHQIAPNLFIGSHFELARIRTQSEYAVVHASHKAHKQLLGYPHGAPKNREYFNARRQNHLYVNIITHSSPIFYHRPLIEVPVRFIHEQRSVDHDVYIYSDQGGNRPSGIALVYMANERLIPHESFEAALTEFHKLYPYTRLVGGLYLHIRHHWETYMELLQKPNIVNQ